MNYIVICQYINIDTWMYIIRKFNMTLTEQKNCRASVNNMFFRIRLKKKKDRWLSNRDTCLNSVTLSKAPLSITTYIYIYTSIYIHIYSRRDPARAISSALTDLCRRARLHYCLQFAHDLHVQTISFNTPYYTFYIFNILIKSVIHHNKN